MIGLDTNVLARYYIDDVTDLQARRQRPAAQALIESGQPLSVCKTVIIELEWLMRKRYRLPRTAVLAALLHMLGLAHVMIEDRTAVSEAVSNYAHGLAFADALHHASYAKAESIASFDDRKFARRVAALGLQPLVMVLR